MLLPLSLLYCILSTAWSAPVDEPVRVDLPVYNEPGANKDQPSLSSDIYLNTPLEPENNSDYKKRNEGIKGGLLSGLSENSLGGVFAAPVTSRENVLLEAEGLPSKALSIKDNLHNTAAGLFQPKPIVDTIKEEEKYGNTGDKFYSAGKAIVGGASNVSNFINTLLEVPGNIFRHITKVASQKLNIVGSKLVGL